MLARHKFIGFVALIFILYIDDMQTRENGIFAMRINYSALPSPPFRNRPTSRT